MTDRERVERVFEFMYKNSGPLSLYAGNVFYRPKILRGELIILAETKNGKPIDRLDLDMDPREYDTAVFMADKMNDHERKYHAAKLNGRCGVGKFTQDDIELGLEFERKYGYNPYGSAAAKFNKSKKQPSPKRKRIKPTGANITIVPGAGEFAQPLPLILPSDAAGWNQPGTDIPMPTVKRKGTKLKRNKSGQFKPRIKVYARAIKRK